MNRIRPLFLTILGFSIVIGIHEAGHLITAKLFSVYSPTFSIGFGPVIARVTMGTTTYQLAALPLGGYTEIPTKPTTQKDAYKAYTFQQKFFDDIPAWQQLIILVSGILCNLFLTFTIFLTIGLMGLRPSLAAITKPQEEPLIGGPIFMAQQMMANAHHSLLTYSTYIALLSSNLAFINMLPIPILDGGKIMLLIGESILNTELSTPIENSIVFLSALVLLLLLIIVTSNDLRRLFKS